jgi:hypothetical protein
VLYALYGLLDVERVEGLEQDSRDLNNFGYLVNHANARNAPKVLQQDRDAIERALQAGPGKERHSGMSLGELATFPGMPHFGKVS